MCRVRKDLVDDDILGVGANEANEDEVSTYFLYVPSGQGLKTFPLVSCKSF